MRDVAHQGRRLLGILRDRVGGAVGERDHHGNVMGDDVMHFPGDPGPFRCCGKLYVPLPLPLQVRPSAARVVAEQAGDGHQEGETQPLPRQPLHSPPVAQALEVEEYRTALQRDHGGQHPPTRLPRPRRPRRSASWWLMTRSSSGRGSRRCWASSRESTWWAPPQRPGGGRAGRRPNGGRGADGRADARVRRHRGDRPDPPGAARLPGSDADDVRRRGIRRAGAAGRRRRLPPQGPARRRAGQRRPAGPRRHCPVRPPGHWAAGLGAGQAPGPGARRRQRRDPPPSQGSR